MASFTFPLGAEKILQGMLDWTTADVRAVLLQSGVTIDADTMEYLSDVPEAWRIAKSGTITGKSISAGMALSHAVLFEDFIDSEARQVGAILLVCEGVDDASTLLVAYYEGTTGFPFVGNGRSYFIAPLGGQGWFNL